MFLVIDTQATRYALPDSKFSVCKTESLFWEIQICLVCLSASLTHPGVTLANFSISDPWRLSPRRHRVPIALTQTLGLSQTPPPASPCVLTSRICSGDLLRCRVLTLQVTIKTNLLACVDFSHLTGRPQSKHFLLVRTIIKQSHKEAAVVRCSAQFDRNEECAGLSARISITTINEFRSSTSLLLLRKREASAVEPVAGASEVGRLLRPR